MHILLRPFAGSIRFDGSEQMVRALLEKIVHAGVTVEALVCALVLTSKLCELVKSSAGEEAAAIPPTAAKAIILTTAILASKYNFDIGARMKDVKLDDVLVEELGDGLVSNFGILEEHFLGVFNWQLRVTPEEFADAYAHLAALSADAAAADEQLSPPVPIVRMHSSPAASQTGAFG